MSYIPADRQVVSLVRCPAPFDGGLGSAGEAEKAQSFMITKSELKS